MHIFPFINSTLSLFLLTAVFPWKTGLNSLSSNSLLLFSVQPTPTQFFSSQPILQKLFSLRWTGISPLNPVDISFSVLILLFPTRSLWHGFTLFFWSTFFSWFPGRHPPLLPPPFWMLPLPPLLGHRPPWHLIAETLQGSVPELLLFYICAHSLVDLIQSPCFKYHHIQPSVYPQPGFLPQTPDSHS